MALSLIKGAKQEGFPDDLKVNTGFSRRSGILKNVKVQTEEAPAAKQIAPAAEPSQVFVPPTGEEKKKKKEEEPPKREELPPPPPPPPPVDKQIIEEAEKKAQEILRRAQAEAKKLIEESKLYCQSAFSQAEREGFLKGKEEGIAAGREEMAQMMNEARNVLSQVYKEREALLRSVEPEMAKLAIKIAERIIQSEISINDDVVVNLIRAALSRVKEREEVILKVSREDYEHVMAKRDVFAQIVEGLKTLDVVVDPAVQRGGCIIETNLGNVDARISTQLAAIELAFGQVEKEFYAES
jgi:flagellar assembly protein FliH